MPWPFVLPPEGNLHSEASVSIQRKFGGESLSNVLASHQRGDSIEIISSSSAIAPHTNEELRGKVVDFVEVKEKRLEGCRSRICQSPSVKIQSEDGGRHRHPGAKTCQCSDRISTTSFEALAIGHLLSNDRLICSRIRFAN